MTATLNLILSFLESYLCYDPCLPRDPFVPLGPLPLLPRKTLCCRNPIGIKSLFSFLFSNVAAFHFIIEYLEPSSFSYLINERVAGLT